MQLTVMDQNGQPLGLVIVVVQMNGNVVAEERTTASGNALVRQLAPGSYRVLVEKQGFYTTEIASLEIVAGQTAPVEVRLQPVREYKEEIEVAAQPSPIDPQESSSAQSITATDISNIPYPTTRDYRNVLRYIPGVLGDGGQIHIAGASTQEIQDYLDGFEVSQPATGALSMRLNPDSLRKIEVRNSRYSAQFGKGSGGLVDLQLQDGDNHFRVNATDFVPTLQHVRGSASTTGLRADISPDRWCGTKSGSTYPMRERPTTTSSRNCRMARTRTEYGASTTWPVCA